jgi:hypothetical protein
LKHLRPEEFVDFVDGGKRSTSHLDACPECRDHLDQMRQTMKMVADTDVPEPSPIFWDHLSSRVHEAIANDISIARPWLTGWFVPASVAAIIALAFALSIYAPSRSANQQTPQPSASAAVTESIESTRELLADTTANDNDPSLLIVSDLASAIDLDDASDAGMAPDNSAEHAITHMSTAELGELRLLLQEEWGVI